VIELLSGEIPGIKAWNPGADSKVARAEAVAFLHDSGNVYVPRNAPWWPEVSATWGKFPLVKHDDDVDAMTMALLILYTPRKRRWVDAVEKMRAG
jgi:predicted phage terminase large subunit-like protein